MDKTVRALTDLSAIDDQLSRKEVRMGGLVHALEQRAALRQAIPRVFLAAYDARGRVGRHPVIVEVRGGYCGGCRLRLPPQLDLTIRWRQSPSPCPHCGRLLYSSPRVLDRESAPESKHGTEDSIAQNASKSKRARGVSGKRRCQEGRASKR
jgi:hypothetical protein